MKGKPYTDEQKEQAILSLKDYLTAGFSRAKACELVGLADSTLSNWVQKDETLGMRLKGWENTLNALAMSNMADALRIEGEQDDNARKENTRWWLERRMKKDFSTQTNTDITSDGKALPTPILSGILNSNDVSSNDSSDEGQQTE